MRGQLSPHGLVAVDGILFARRHVDEVDEHRAALDVGEELVPEPGPFRRTFNQSRNVGDNRLPVLAFDRSQDGRERRERIVTHLRRGPGQAAQ